MKGFREARHQERVSALKGEAVIPVTEKPKPVEKVEAKPDAPKKKSLEGRKQVVDAEIAELQNSLRIRAELQKQLKATEPKATEPATTKAPAKSSWADHPDAPKLEQFPDYESFLDARAEFIADKKFEARMAERDQRADQERTVSQRFEGVTKAATTFKERVESFQKATPNAQIDERLTAIMPLSAVEAYNLTVPADQREPVGPHHFVVEQIFRSEIPGPLLVHFSQKPDDFQRLYTLASADPAGAIREIGRLEAQIGPSSASPAPSPSARVSTVPNPPTVLGGKVATLDPMRSAVKNGDMRAFKALKRQEVAARLGVR